VGREYNEDPVLATLLPATWLSARRRTILVLHRSDDGVTAAAVSRYPVGQFLPAWSPEDGGGRLTGEQSQWAEVRRIVEQAAPRRIGIDVSADFALADGLSHTEHRLVTEALGPWADRLVSAEDLAVGWLETRLPEEIAALDGLNRRVREVVEEAFSPAVLTAGVSTATDVAWWLRQRLADLGVEPVVPPGGRRAARGGGAALRTRARCCRRPYDVPVQPGDLVHCDVGLSSLGLKTDSQRNGYVLRRGETDAPAGLRRALAVGTGCRTSPRRSSSPAAPATRCWPRPVRRRGRGHRRRRLLPPGRRPRHGRAGDRPLGRPGGVPAPATGCCAPTPSTPSSCACGCRYPSGAASRCAWHWRRAWR
jgi:hypothetical protein